METRQNSKFKTILRILLLFLVFLVLLVAGELLMIIAVFIYYGIHGTSLTLISSHIESLFSGGSFGFLVVSAVVQNIITVIAVLLFLKGSLKDKFSELKLTIKPDSHKLFLTGVLIGFLSIIAITFIGLITGLTKFQNIGLKSFSSILSMFFSSLILFLSVGFGEEILSRGYILRQLLNCGGTIWGVLGSAFIFMLFHIGTYSKLLDFMDVFFIGVFLACMYIKSGSLWLSIGFHFMWDFTQSYIIRIENTSYNANSIFKFSVPKDAYIFGIDIGCKFELVFILIALILIFLILYVYKGIDKKNITEEG